MIITKMEWLIFDLSTSNYLMLALVVVMMMAMYHNYYHGWKTAWEGLNVPGPKYRYITGYKSEMGGKKFSEAFPVLVKKYGRNISFYLDFLRVPALVTCDLKLLKHILVKDFQNFTDRAENFNTTSDLRKALFFIGGDDWRRVRHLTSPYFSSGKLKGLFTTINNSAGNLGKHMAKKAESGNLIQIKKETGHFTSELIALMGFGLNPKAVGQDGDCEFTVQCSNLLRLITKPGIKLQVMGLLAFFFPFLKSVYTWPPNPVTPEADQYFTQTLTQTMSKRKQLDENRSHDFLDLLMKSGAETDPQKCLDTEEILGQSKLLIFAGYETTSTTLAMCLYFLAKHQDVQEKVFDEISENIKGDKPTYEEIQGLKYCEQVLNETLRLMPPLSSITRKCKETRTYGGTTIPAGAHVQIPIFYLLKDPEVWEEPDKFDPDRFNDENKAKRDPLSFIPFGYGPRLCLGQRLAYLEAKAGLVHVMKNVRVYLTEDTYPKLGEDIKFEDGLFIKSEKPLQLAVESRA